MRTTLPTVLCSLLVVLAATLALADEGRPAAVPLDLAVMETPAGTTLDDILTGRAQPGFTPILAPGFPFTAREGSATWVRIRTELPPAPEERWVLRVGRVPLDRLVLRVPPEGRVMGEDGFFVAGPRASTWPAAFTFNLPRDSTGPATYYLELRGRVRGGMHLELVDAAASARADAAARSFFRWVYGLMVLVALLSVARHVEDPSCGALAVGGTALCAWLAALGANGHLYLLPELALLGELGATVPQALLLFAAGPLVLATRHFSGLAKSAPDLVLRMQLVGWGLVALALVGFFLDISWALDFQWVAWAGNALAVGVSAYMLLLDSRSTRWWALFMLAALVLAVLARVLADHQVLPDTLLSLHGWQLVLALLVVVYLGLPWLRVRLQRWAVRRRAQPPEPTAQERVDLARKRLMESLEQGLKSAAEGDLEWIAFRRLLEGLRPVLRQISSAVVAMDYHGEDILQVEPKEAEPRYRELLSQRTSLLKNLGRLRAPQQVGIDFDGPEGPLEQVQLAVIPLPIAKPGWGALLVEREADVTYSDDELALCAEFAAVATIAGDEAATARDAKHASEIDPASGVYRHELIVQVLRQQLEKARFQNSALSVLDVVIDPLAKLREQRNEDGQAACLSLVAELLRDELRYGESLGRSGPDGFLFVMPALTLVQARERAEKLCVAITRLAINPRVATALSLSIGVAQASPGERDAEGLLARAARAAQVARRNGGNQIFS